VLLVGICTLLGPGALDSGYLSFKFTALSLLFIFFRSNFRKSFRFPLSLPGVTHASLPVTHLTENNHTSLGFYSNYVDVSKIPTFLNSPDDDQTLINIEDANQIEQDLHAEFGDPTAQSTSAVYYKTLKPRLLPKVIDMKKFVETTGNKPIFTRSLIQNAVEQLGKAKKRERVEFLDGYGEIHRFETKEAVEMQ